MKWTIRLELTPDGNPPITYDTHSAVETWCRLEPLEMVGVTTGASGKFTPDPAVRKLQHRDSVCERSRTAT
jgi:hypothetical protein